MNDTDGLDLKIAKLKNLDIAPQVGHVWKRDEYGEIDMNAYDGDMHSGPRCTRCGYMYCQWCHPDGRGRDDDCHPTCPPFTQSLTLAMDLYEEMETAGIVSLSNGDGDSVDFNFIPYSVVIGPISTTGPKGIAKSLVICLAWITWKEKLNDETARFYSPVT